MPVPIEAFYVLAGIVVVLWMCGSWFYQQIGKLNAEQKEKIRKLQAEHEFNKKLLKYQADAWESYYKRQQNLLHKSEAKELQLRDGSTMHIIEDEGH